MKTACEKCDENNSFEDKKLDTTSDKVELEPPSITANENDKSGSHSDISSLKSQTAISVVEPESSQSAKSEYKEPDGSEEEFALEKNDFLFDDDIVLLTYKRNGLIQLKEQLSKDMHQERKDIEVLKSKLEASTSVAPTPKVVIPKQETLDEVMTLLQNENKILQIKKINLVRKIIEQKELCIELSAQLRLAENDKYSNF